VIKGPLVKRLFFIGLCVPPTNHLTCEKARRRATRRRGGALFSMRNLQWLDRHARFGAALDHEGPFPHPAEDQVQ